MARKRVIERVPPLQNWDDVNTALTEIARTDRILKDIEMQMQAQMAKSKTAAEIAAKPNQERLVMLEKQIKAYAEEHRADFGSAKSKALNFGTVSFRKSTRVKLPKAADKVAEIIRKLKQRNMLNCIIQPKAKVDKEALKKYSEEVVAAVGAQLITEDVFGYELDQERLKQAE